MSKELALIAENLHSCCLTATSVYKELKSFDIDKHLSGYERCLIELNLVIEEYESYRQNNKSKLLDLHEQGKTIEDKEVVELFEICFPKCDIDEYRKDS